MIKCQDITTYNMTKLLVHYNTLLILVYCSPILFISKDKYQSMHIFSLIEIQEMTQEITSVLQSYQNILDYHCILYIIVSFIFIT